MAEEKKPEEKKAPSKMNETALEVVISRVQQFAATGTMDLPPNYSPENAARQAYLHLLDMTVRVGPQGGKVEKPVLEVVTQASVVKSIMRMLNMGLNISKGQGYFIAYGDQLEFDEGVWGKRAQAKKADPEILDINAQVVYEKDEFSYVINRGKKDVTSHVQAIENVGGPIKAAYGVIEYTDGRTKTEIMSIQQLEAAWSMNPYANSSAAHQKFRERMAEKSVLNRLLRGVISDSDDSALQIDPDAKAAAREVAAKANRIPLNPPPPPTRRIEPEEQKTEDISHEEPGF